MKKVREVDLSDRGESKNTFILKFRTRKDGRTSTWVGRLRLPEKDRVARKGNGNPYVTVSLGTVDQAEAMKKAIDWRRNWGPGNRKKAMLANTPTFGDAADRWLEHENAKAMRVRASGQRARSRAQIRRWDTSVRRYLKPVFGDLPVNEIALDDAQRWASWRQRYYVDGPGAEEIENGIEYERNGKSIKRPAQARAKIRRSTIGKDADAFSKVISFARSEYPHLIWSQPVSLLKVAKETDETEPRLRFSRAQRGHVFENASVRAHGINFETYEDPPFNREVLYNLVRFLWCTGLRVSEAKLLKVKHVLVIPTLPETPMFVPTDNVVSFGYDGSVDEFSQEMAQAEPSVDQYEFKYKFAVDWVKRKIHRRKVTPRLGIYNVMQRHLDHLDNNLGTLDDVDWTYPTTSSDEIVRRLSSLPAELPLFPNADGGTFDTMDRMHNRLLESVRGDFPDGLRVIDGQTMSLSCWRHTYASELLEYYMKQSNPNLVNWLAGNMGTSPAMIHKHYGHILAEAAEKDLMV